VRENWDRTAPLVDLDIGKLTVLIQQALPGARVIASTPAQGGLANATYRLALADREAPLLIRFFVRDPLAAGKEFALGRMLAGRVPIVPYFHVAADNPFTGHPYAIREWVDGERLDIAARRLTDPEIAEVGRAVGAALASIHAVIFAETGFLDAALHVAQQASMGSADLVHFLKLCLVDGRGAQRIEPGLVGSLIAFAGRAGRILDDWTGDPCLVHADFGGSNILVRRNGPRWEVASILDWEFTFSGTPFFDFGNLLRPPLGERPGFETAVVAGYLDAGGKLPDKWRRMSLLTDLFNWADFLNRPHATAALIADATMMIRRTMAEA
jgi:aminoglycoside phosphotransferase (APT) family kinase protein